MKFGTFLLLQSPTARPPEEIFARGVRIGQAADRLGYEYSLSVAGVATPPVSLRRGHFHREKLMSVLAAIDLDAARTTGNGLSASDERATIVVVHPDRTDTGIAPATSWHFTARQLDSLLEPASGRETIA